MLIFMGKTVTTYLFKSDPKGSRYYLISNRVCKMMVIPRNELSIVKEKDELKHPSFYILIGEDEDSKPKAYIGQTENFVDRVKIHDNKKDFWNVALVFVSIAETLTKANVEYLEYKGINLAKKVNVFVLDENKQVPNMPTLPEYQRDTMEEFFDGCKFLISFVGLKLFESVNRKKEHLFFIHQKGINSVGVYNSNGLTVLKGSTIYEETAKKISQSMRRNREKLIAEHTKKIKGKLTLIFDLSFNSPSGASLFCLGNSTNGWSFWKDKDGRTLDEIYRK